MPLAANVTVDSTTWAALALVLTVLGAAYSWVAFRRRGLAAGLRGLAWTLVPVAAWLTGTLRLAGNILDDVVSWAARLVFSPTVWLGVVVAGIAVLLWVVSGFLRARGLGVRGTRTPPGQASADKALAQQPPQVPSGGRKRRRKPADDDLDNLDDIEAILKKHGI